MTAFREPYRCRYCNSNMTLEVLQTAPRPYAVFSARCLASGHLDPVFDYVGWDNMVAAGCDPVLLEGVRLGRTLCLWLDQEHQAPYAAALLSVRRPSFYDSIQEAA